MPTFSSYNVMGANVDIDSELALGVGSSYNAGAAELIITVVQGTMTAAYAGTIMYNQNNANTSDAINDEWNFKTYLQAGTYSIKTVYNKNNMCGIVKLSVDGTLKDTFDTYGAGGTNNHITISTSIVVSVSGLVTISYKSDTKNGASSAYRMIIQGVNVMRTS